MHELTAAEKQAYVRSVWENVHFITSYRQPSLWRLKFGPIITRADSQDECWDAAYAFTLAREEEDAEVRERNARRYAAGLRAEQAPAPAEQDTGLVEGAMDFPQAWEFTRSTKESDHSPKCSWIQARLLCDCAVLWAEDYKRRLSVARARIREQAGREVRAERVRSRMMGIEDAIHAFSDESLVTENKALHTAIENFWKCQASGHQCGCDKWPECKHTLDAHDLRKIAMGVDRPGCRTAQPAKEGTR